MREIVITEDCKRCRALEAENKALQQELARARASNGALRLLAELTRRRHE